MTKDEAVEFMISKVEEIERERIAAKFSSTAKTQKKLAVDAILKAINLGDDTDTVGAVVGGLLGIEYGMKAINPNWVKQIQNKELLDSICERFNQLTIERDDINNMDFKKQLEVKYMEISRQIIKSINENKSQKKKQNEEIDFEK